MQGILVNKKYLKKYVVSEDGDFSGILHLLS